MGIPSYFSHLVKKHASSIVREVPSSRQKVFTSLYMDCNSIIYDAYNNMLSDVTEDEIIKETIHRIKELVRDFHPTNVLYIAFDGVAPAAKMEQQRTRRYKTLNRTSGNSGWNTAAITPGTKFMAKLMAKIRGNIKRISGTAKKVVFSGSNEEGEGEHKLFEYMRKQGKNNDRVAIYGLDADLIMLALAHVNLCENIYICRESPEFGLSEEFTSKNKLLCLDVKKLAKSISDTMEYDDPHETVLDYVFLCFLLGNDFLPHFPALNIRTNGIYTLLDTYKRIYNKTKMRIITGEKTIHWEMVHLLFMDLYRQEHSLWLKEYDQRAKLSDHYMSEVQTMTPEKQWDYVPLLYRAKELYICPTEHGWETRYYMTLFGEKYVVNEIVANYIEGLEWVFHYYTKGCIDWKWKYKYHYPPLLKDLAKYKIVQPQWSLSSGTTACSPTEQLMYVLPPAYWEELIPDCPVKQCTQPPVKLEWSFCKYMWEAHVLIE
jgi:5'-3' exonuclease